MNLKTCVDPSGKFIYGIHNPTFRVRNFREKDYVSEVGKLETGEPVSNQGNFPSGSLEETGADAVYEIFNAFPFKGVTFITKSWADKKAKYPESILLPSQPPISFSQSLPQWLGRNSVSIDELKSILQTIPPAIRLSVAQTSSDPMDLTALAQLSCDFVYDLSQNRPAGLKFHSDDASNPKPVIHDPLLYEIVSNNPALPDDYKEVMVLRPGVQGKSEIVGEWTGADGKSHVLEYLRRNSYIPGGHYAANMAHDAVRYRVRDLTIHDMTGMRHLYYQRTYARVADELGIHISGERKTLLPEELENLRIRIIEALSASGGHQKLKFNRTLWGWNFGFDYAPSGYRLHASHQQIHQQYALIPSQVSISGAAEQNSRPAIFFNSYACGDLIADFIEQYAKAFGKDFFEAYINAINANRRIDGKDGEASLIIYSDSRVILFVPKAQTSQWEIQLMALSPAGNIIEADILTRRSIDAAILIAVRILELMGAKLITSIEYSKAFDQGQTGQRLIYAFLPRLPESPGAFSESQLRWINGHYPEDFAAACRRKLPEAVPDLPFI